MGDLENTAEALWELPPPPGGMHLGNNPEKIKAGAAHFAPFFQELEKVCADAGIQVTQTMKLTGVLKVTGEQDTLVQTRDALIRQGLLLQPLQPKP